MRAIAHIRIRKRARGDRRGAMRGERDSRIVWQLRQLIDDVTEFSNSYPPTTTRGDGSYANFSCLKVPLVVSFGGASIRESMQTVGDITFPANVDNGFSKRKVQPRFQSLQKRDSYSPLV